MSREAMKLALEALESDPISHAGLVIRKQAITALRQALETEQEPVAWIHDGGKGELWWYRSSKFDQEGNLIGYDPDDVPLYTSPPKREWVGLTGDEVYECWKTGDVVAAVETKLKEKNHG